MKVVGRKVRTWELPGVWKVPPPWNSRGPSVLSPPLCPLCPTCIHPKQPRFVHFNLPSVGGAFNPHSLGQDRRQLAEPLCVPCESAPSPSSCQVLILGESRPNRDSSTHTTTTRSVSLQRAKQQSGQISTLSTAAFETSVSLVGRPPCNPHRPCVSRARPSFGIPPPSRSRTAGVGATLTCPKSLLSVTPRHHGNWVGMDPDPTGDPFSNRLSERGPLPVCKF